MNIKDILEKQKHNAVNIVVIILSIFISYKLYSGQVVNLSSVQQQIKSNDEIILLLGQLSSVSQKEQAVKKAVSNTKGQSAILQVFNDMAKDFSIEIVSVVPEGEKNFGLYNFRQFSLKVKCKNYHDLGNFISKIETSQDIFMIDRLNITSTLMSNKANSQEKFLSVDLIVGTISIT